MYGAATFGGLVLVRCLLDFAPALHAPINMYVQQFCPSSVSVHALSAEDTPEESNNLELENRIL